VPPKSGIKGERKKMNLQRVYEVLPEEPNTNPIDFIELEEERDTLLIYNLYDYKTEEFKGLLLIPKKEKVF